MPLAAAMKFTVLPTEALWLVGWVVNTGALVPLSCSVALLLATLPTELETTTEYVPTSEACTLAKVSVALVWPNKLVPFFSH